MIKFTKKKIFGSRLSIKQPVNGYRAAIDPILLAAAIPAKPGERVFDVGAGAGVASLALAVRVRNIQIQGIEIQTEYVQLAKENARHNEFENRVSFFDGDISKIDKKPILDSFNHVMTNPPFIKAGQGRVSKHYARATANMESKLGLTDWINFCIRVVKTRGTITLIHRADRLEQILSAFNGKVGGLIIYPFWAGLEKVSGLRPAKRVIVQGRKGINSPTTLTAGLLLHNIDGGYTEAAKNVLSEAKEIKLSSY